MLGIDIFISYRRSDRPTAAKEIADSFAEAFGADEVFFDQQTELGIEYPDYIRANLRLAKVVLVIIGPDWATIADEQGRQRLDAKDDWVRMEVATALETKRNVIPVLVEGAELPKTATLPSDLRSLAQRQAFTVRFEADDVSRLVKAIGKIPGLKRRPQASGTGGHQLPRAIEVIVAIVLLIGLTAFVLGIVTVLL